MIEMIPELTSQRLIMRAPRQEDFPTYRAFYADAKASHFYGGPMTASNAWKQLAMEPGHWMLKGYGMWSLESRSTGEMVGGCGFWWPDGWPRPELTWWLIKPAQGNGLATEASVSAINFAYRKLNWNSVETHLNDDNEAACKLVLRLGGSILTREIFPDGIERNVYSIPPSKVE
jgi:ribosomal-protein-alanine N-acetyltransferase